MENKQQTQTGKPEENTPTDQALGAAGETTHVSDEDRKANDKKIPGVPLVKDIDESSPERK